jgi:hypothetical protein
MNWDLMHQKLLAAARSQPPSELVPYAFEKRVMARLSAGWSRDPWTLWGQTLWRAAASCLAVMVLSGIWSFCSVPAESGDTNFSQEFETAVFVMADQMDDDE